MLPNTNNCNNDKVKRISIKKNEIFYQFIFYMYIRIKNTDNRRAFLVYFTDITIR